MMHRTFFFQLVLACAAIFAGGLVQAGEPSVLVKLVALRTGALPRQITAYGRVEASAAGRLSITARDAAEVSEVFVHLGQSVDKGTRLLQVRPTPRAAAGYAQARSALRAAQELTARTQALLLQHLATAQQVAGARQAEADARANLEALDRVGAGGPTIIRAPCASIVTALSAQPGMLVSEGAQMLDLARPHDLVLSAGLPPAQAASIHAGDKVEISALGEQTSVPGVVSMRGSAVDPSTGLVPVQMTFPQRHLLPGQAATALITAGMIRGFVVPREAVLVNDDGEPYVVQAQAMRARKVTVDIVGAQGDQEVVAGRDLVPNQPVVVSGNYQLDDGMALRLADVPGKSAP